MEIKAFYDARTNTLSYVVWDPQSLQAVIIDPVLDYDPVASKVWYESVHILASFIAEHHLKVAYILETHAHADHLSSAQTLKTLYPKAILAIGQHITEVQKTFASLFDLNIKTDGSQFDKLFQDNEKLQIGSLALTVLFTPGHTPACVTYKINDALFTGDTLFMPDYGTGRCDFPQGSAKQLYHSVKNRLYVLPDHFRCFTGHDYQPNGREIKWESSLLQQKQHNVHLTESTSEQAFVEFRENRDKSLSMPKLLYQSVQVNMVAGVLPKHLKIPLYVSV